MSFTPVLIGNTADYSEIKMLKEGNVSAGDEILSSRRFEYNYIIITNFIGVSPV